MKANAFLSLLLLLFIGLKLGNVIGWSWWWVLSPFWIPVSTGLLLLGVSLFLRQFETPNEKAARLMREYADALQRKRS